MMHDFTTALREHSIVIIALVTVLFAVLICWLVCLSAWIQLVNRKRNIRRRWQAAKDNKWGEEWLPRQRKDNSNIGSK